jgi:hypothetical protein
MIYYYLDAFCWYYPHCGYNFVCRVDMKLLYCGFNGFGQCPTARSSTVSQLTEYPVTGVREVSVAWSCVAVLTGRSSSSGSIHLLLHTP